MHTEIIGFARERTAALHAAAVLVVKPRRRTVPDEVRMASPFSTSGSFSGD